MKRPLYLLVILVGLAVLFAALFANWNQTAAEEKKPPTAADTAVPKKGEGKPGDKLGRFMHQKLDASNEVLEGLVTEDFALIEKGAATMRKLSAAEQWQVSNDALYRQHSNQFRRIMENLEKKAKDKELEGATLAWVEGTMSCLECHKWVRNNIVAGK